MYIAIDTSTEIASVALAREGQVLAELTWRCGQSHTAELLPNLMALLSQAKLDIKSAGGIIVAKGPGSFNGLRVGVSTAKGLAYSLGVPIAGISTLEAEAYPYAEFGLPVCPVHNAGRDEIATAIYQKKRGTWRQVKEEHISTVEALCSGTTARTVFCGEFSAVVAGQLKEKLRRKAVILSTAASLRRAGFLAELGWQRLEAGDHDDVATLQPVYLRRPPVSERRHL